jgi:hypothetical protein
VIEHFRVFSHVGFFYALTEGYVEMKKTTDAACQHHRNSVVATFKTHTQAEEAVKHLAEAGFDMKLLSIVGKGYHTEENVVGYYNAGDRMLYWGTQGAFWGGFWALLFGSGFFLVPGIGPLLVAGPLVAAIVGALESAVVVGGFSALGAALASIGIPNNSIVAYEASIKSGQFLMVAHGTPEEIERAKVLLGDSGATMTESFIIDEPAAAIA